MVRLGFECDALVPMRDKPERLDGEIPWVRIEDFAGKYISASKSGQGVSQATVEAMNLKVFPIGTVLCSCSCSMGATAIVARPLVTNQTFIGIVPHAGFSSGYLYYCFQAAAEQLNVLSTGAIQAYLSRDDFRRLRLPQPPSDEQIAITAFLDQETAKIDALVGEQRQLIELLREKRSVLITESVTGGLQSNVRTKPSGIDWLGQVPEHWVIRRLRHLSPKITVGIVVEPSRYYVDSGVPALRSLNIAPGRITLDNLVFISAEANKMHAKSILQSGDLVAVRSGQPGTTAVVPPELDGCNCIDLIIIRRPRGCTARFLCWYLASHAAVTQFAIGVDGAIQRHFNVGTAHDLIVVVPPRVEQDAIADFLEAETRRLDTLITEVDHAIGLLLERRAALISAAVTGQIDVRSSVASEVA
jgi:type I restriction enzyme S subunit